MIAEEKITISQQPDLDISGFEVIELIVNIMCENVVHFKGYLSSGHYTKQTLNEDELSQIYIEQAQILIRKKGYPFNISGQYRDIYNLGKGYSDIYFYPNELGPSNSSLFSVECKRLPSPDRYREKEYVLGNSNNGGIERYKKEKHGKGLSKAGLIGFIEYEDPKFWIRKINSWIIDKAIIDSFWKKDEVLQEIKNESDYAVLDSIAYRANDKIDLIHLWIILS